MSRFNEKLRREMTHEEEKQAKLLDYLNSVAQVQLRSRLMRTGRIVNVISGLNFRYFNEYPSQKFVENAMAIMKVDENPLSEPYDLDASTWGARICVNVSGEPIFITHKEMHEKAGYSIVHRNGHNIVVPEMDFSSLEPCEHTLENFIKVLGNKVTNRDMKTVMDAEISQCLEELKQEYPELVDDKLQEELLDETPTYHISSIMKSDVLQLLIDRILSKGNLSVIGIEEQNKRTMDSLRINLDEKLRVTAQEALSGITKIIVYNAAWGRQRRLIQFISRKLPELNLSRPPTTDFQEKMRTLLLVLGIRRLDINLVRSCVYPHRRTPHYYKERRDALWDRVSGPVRKMFVLHYGDLS